MAHIGGCIVSGRRPKQVSVRFAWRKCLMGGIVRKSRITNLNRSFVPMHTFPHLDGDPIKELQWEGGVVLEVSPVLCIPVPVEDPDGDDRILDTLVGFGF